MKLSAVKNSLEQLSEVKFLLPDGTAVPAHFHVTEVGTVDRKFIDCGGTLRQENLINFQLWFSDDYDHRLGAETFSKIIALSEDKLGLSDSEVEVEYQSDTIGRYDLEFDGTNFQLKPKFTDCLAKDNCGIPQEKRKMNLSDLVVQNKCEPGGGCC